MKVVTAFPRPVRVIEHCWIPLPDGCRLAARVWLPEDAGTAPVPAILEYIPYRKRDFTRVRDQPMHHYFAGHGYAALRVDVRGSGDSEGTLVDEYSEEELTDGVAVIAWIAAQPWCTGAVGMMGKSWGGFNALQIAARRPPALKAVITVCASDDRYTDDAHYMGGCLLNENLTWGCVLQAFSALPPDPVLVGEPWRATWVARLEHAVLFADVWLRHQRHDAYWKRGSVSGDLARIACPVFAVGGWADAYTNAIPRLLAGLTVPRKALVGPWAHVYPHIGVPGPAIGFLQQALRWWDRWLKDVDTGVMDEPLYRVWMSGRWVAEPAWPSPRCVPERWMLEDGGLLRQGHVVETAVQSRSPQSVGLAAGEWCAFDESEAAGDQRDDDARSLTFDSEPLDARLEMLGTAVAILEVAVDRSQAFLAVRLNDVAPDGSSVRATYGVLDLTHRTGHEHPEPLEPGRRYTVRVALNHAAYAFAPGHRIRLAISTAYWPVVWPSPAPVQLTVFTGASRLEVPVRPPAPEDERLPRFAEPEAAPAPAYRELRPTRAERTVEREGDEVVYTVTSTGGAFRAGGPGRMEEIDLEIEESSVRRYRIRDDDPLSARAEVVQRMALRRGPWAVRVESRASFWASRERFELRAAIEAWEGERVVASRSWERSIPREGA